jgi:hypothetical protein
MIHTHTLHSITDTTIIIIIIDTGFLRVVFMMIVMIVGVGLSTTILFYVLDERVVQITGLLRVVKAIGLRRMAGCADQTDQNRHSGYRDCRGRSARRGAAQRARHDPDNCYDP